MESMAGGDGEEMPATGPPRQPIAVLRAFVNGARGRGGCAALGLRVPLQPARGELLDPPGPRRDGHRGRHRQPAGPLRRHAPGDAPGLAVAVAPARPPAGAGRASSRSFAPCSSASWPSTPPSSSCRDGGSLGPRAFFVWASIANLLVVSIAWGSLAGRFTSDQAHRLYGFIAAGGTLGAIAGSSLAGAAGGARRADLADATRRRLPGGRACWPPAACSGRSDRLGPEVSTPGRVRRTTGRPGGGSTRSAWASGRSCSPRPRLRLHGAGPDRQRLHQRCGRPDRVLRADRPAGQRDGADLAGLDHRSGPRPAGGGRCRRAPAGDHAGRLDRPGLAADRRDGPVVPGGPPRRRLCDRPAESRGVLHGPRPRRTGRGPRASSIRPSTAQGTPRGPGRTACSPPSRACRGPRRWASSRSRSCGSS